ncbi:MAG: ATP-binding protein, partial [Patescibacteria group bacterium]
LKPLTVKKRWLWTGTDFSESASVSENSLAIRVLTDLALITSNISAARPPQNRRSFGIDDEIKHLDFDFLLNIYTSTPGLTSDKLKGVFEKIWPYIKEQGYVGVVFAYDEAQILDDHAKEKEYPLSVLLEVFQSIQKKEIPFLLVLTGLPTLQPHLIEARTYSERLFHVLILDKLSQKESEEAILKPIYNHPLKFDDNSVKLIVETSGGYPYFIQFICKEVYDIFFQKIDSGEKPFVPIATIIQKLDNDFFAGRWTKTSDRQKELIMVIVTLKKDEFGVQEIAKQSEKILKNPFKESWINQMLATLIEAGLIYKGKRGSYSFAVPLFEKYILRTEKGFFENNDIFQQRLNI